MYSTGTLRLGSLGTTREVTLRMAVRDEVPGSIIAVTPTKQWTHAHHPYVSGDITGTRFDVAALGLTPLALHGQGDWDPAEEYWGEEGEPIGAWAKPIITRGKRRMFEMEQIIPGADPEDFDSDPILEAAELREVGDLRGAYDRLMKLLENDLRCLDAHAHLGNLEFDRRPKQALAPVELVVLACKRNALRCRVLRRWASCSCEGLGKGCRFVRAGQPGLFTLASS